MQKFIANVKNSVSKFNNNEDGANALESVMLIALAAIAGVAVYKFGGSSVKWCGDKLEAVFVSKDHENNTKTY